MERGGQHCFVVGGEQPAVNAVLDQRISGAGQPGGDAGQAARHRFDQRQRLRLANGRQHKDVAGPEVLLDRVCRLDERDRLAPTKCGSFVADRRGNRAVDLVVARGGGADEHQTGAHGRRQPPPRSEEQIGTLVAGEESDEENNRLVIGPAQRTAKSGALDMPGRPKSRRVDAVGREADAASRSGLTQRTRAADLKAQRASLPRRATASGSSWPAVCAVSTTGLRSIVASSATGIFFCETPCTWIRS